MAGTPLVHQVLASGRLGGGELVAVELARHIRQRGWGSEAWVPERGPATARLDLARVPWRSFPLHAIKGSTVPRAAALGRWLVRLLAHRPDLAHVHSLSVYGLANPALRLARVKTAVHVHIDPTPEQLRWALRVPPSLVITCSVHIAEMVRAFAREMGLSDMNIEAVQNAVDATAFKPGDKRAAKTLLGADPERPLALMAANLAPHKGQVTALKAIAALKSRGLAFDLWLAGEERAGSTASHIAELKQLTTDLQIEDRVRWLGFRTDIPQLMQAADYFLLPSTREGLPLSLLEAQASGTLVLGSTIPGICEVVDDGKTGFLIPADDAAAFASRMAAVAAQPSTYEAIVTAARAKILREHSAETYLSRITTLYKELADR